MKIRLILYLIGALLCGDMLYLSYFFIFRADYYLPNDYEDAVQALIYGLLFGLPLLGAFVAFLYVQWSKSKNQIDTKP